MVRAAEQRADLAGLNVGVGGHQTAHRRTAGGNLDPFASELFEGLAIDVGDEVTEPVDAQHGPVDAAVLDPWHRDVESRAVADAAAERRELDSFREPRGR